jgi:peptidoglycan/LPS O-acetylase OafA/YrhL
MGVLVYYALNYRGPAFRLLSSVGLALVALSAAASGAALLEPAKNNAQVYLVASVFALSAIVLRQWDGAIVSSALLRPVTACGVMCYSLYLVHVPVVVLIESLFRASGTSPGDISPFVSIPVCAIPSLAASQYFHRSVERRFMSAGSRDHRDTARGTERILATDGSALRVESSVQVRRGLS